jgi:hypothetical protein
VHHEQVADLGLDLAGVAREFGTLLGGNYVNRFNFFDRSYKVIPQIGEADRATVEPLLDLKIKTSSGQLVPVSTFTRIETSTAPRTLNRFQQRNAVKIFGGVRPGVTKEQGLRVLEDAAAAAGAVVDVEVLQAQPAAGTDEHHPAARALARCVEAVEGADARFELCPGVLDTRWYSQLGIPALAYGGGRLEISHGPDEYIDEAAMRRCAAVYTLFAAEVGPG